MYRGIRAPLKRYGYLLAMIPPLFALYFASFLFELIVDPAIPIAEHLWSQIETQAQSTPQNVFLEASARYTWLSLALLNVITPIIACTAAIIVIRASATSYQLKIITTVGTLLCLLSVIHTLDAAQQGDAMYEMVYQFTYQSLVVSERYSEAFLSRVSSGMLVINIIAAIAPNILILAACSTISPTSEKKAFDPKFWAARMKYLKEVINYSSAYLVFGTLHMGVWLQWPAAMIHEEPLRQEVINLAHSITVYWGVCFTLMLILTYGPTAYFLHSRALEVASRNQEGQTSSECEKWLEDHHLTITLGKQLPQLIVMLAPVVAGPLSSTLAGLSHL